MLRYALTAVVLMTAAAADEVGPALSGVYRFVSTAEADGKPVCTERWTFAGGVQTVEGGKEITRYSFRTETDGNDHNWLVRTLTETNGEPDCTGKRDAMPAKPETQRIFFILRNSGSMALCPAPQVMPNGAFYISDCWGEATPLR